MKRQRLFAGILLALLCASQLIGGTGVVYTQNPAPYDELEILFLVDQSGSMGGQDFNAEAGAAPKDPLGLRFEGIQYALDTLGEYRLNLVPDLPIRMNVLNFGDSVSPHDLARGWINIAPTADRTAWEPTRDTLLQALSAEGFSATHPELNLGNTDFVDAYTLALGQFPNNPRRTLRAVILLTDGDPCAPERFDCDSDADKNTEMERLQTLTQTYFPAPDYLLYVLAIDDNGELWRVRQTDWQTITVDPSHASRVETPQQIGATFLIILNELVQTVRGSSGTPLRSLTNGINRVDVPPYTRELRLSFFKADTNPAVLDVQTPNGILLSSDPHLTIQNATRPIEIWRIANPEPGDWLFTLPETTQFSSALEFIPLEVSQQLSQQRFLNLDRIPLEVLLTDNNGNPLPIYPNYPLTVAANITAPDGTVLRVPLTITDGIYSGEFETSLTGDYSVTPSIRVQRVGGESFDLTPQSNSAISFTVGSSVLLLDPIPTGDYIEGKSIALTATLQDNTGAALNLNATEIVAQIIQGNMTQTLPFTAAGSDFQLSLPITGEGEFTLSVSASFEGQRGERRPAAETVSTMFNVLKNQPIVLIRTAPSDSPFRQSIFQGQIPIQHNPLVVDFQAVLSETNAPIDLGTISNTPNALWEVNLTGETLPSDFIPGAVVSSGRVGEYQWVADTLPTGVFELNIRPVGELNDTYIVVSNPIQLTVTREIGRYFYLFWGGTGGTLLLLAVLCGVVLLQRSARARHPASGKLVLRDRDTEKRLWSVNLSAKGSNQLRFRDASLKQAGIKRLTVTCENEQMSKAKRIKLSVELLNGRVISQVLNPGQSYRIQQDRVGGVSMSSATNYELVKDPDSL